MENNTNIGRMDQLIRIERSANKTPNDLGEVEYNYTTVGSFYAAMEDIGGTESNKTDVKVEDKRRRFTIRFASVTGDDRLVYANEYYDIDKVTSIQRNRYTVIEATCRSKLEGIATTGSDIIVTSIESALDGALSIIKFDTPIYFEVGDEIVLGGSPSDGYYYGSNLVALVIDANTVAIDLAYDDEDYTGYTVTRVAQDAPVIVPVVSFGSALGGTATVVTLLSDLREYEDVPVGTVIELITSLEFTTYPGEHVVGQAISPREFIIAVAYDNKEPGTYFTCKLITWQEGD